MQRRAFLQSLAALVGGFALPAIASASDRGSTWNTLVAAKVGLENSSNPWDRVRVEVRWRV